MAGDVINLRAPVETNTHKSSLTPVLLDTMRLESGLLWPVPVEELCYIPRRGRYLPRASNAPARRSPTEPIRHRSDVARIQAAGRNPGTPAPTRASAPKHTRIGRPDHPPLRFFALRVLSGTIAGSRAALKYITRTTIYLEPTDGGAYGILDPPHGGPCAGNSPSRGASSGSRRRHARPVRSCSRRARSSDHVLLIHLLPWKPREVAIRPKDLGMGAGSGGTREGFERRTP